MGSLIYSKIFIDILSLSMGDVQTWLVPGMLRIIKYFDMPLPGVAVRRVAFTADPGTSRGGALTPSPGGLYSADDFYVLDSHLVVMETTIDNYNRSLPLAKMQA